MSLGRYGELLCEMARLEEGHLRHCGEPLHLVRTYTFPLGIETSVEDVSEISASLTHAWHVECEGGHILLRSAEPETAEPFYPGYVLDLLGEANPKERRDED